MDQEDDKSLKQFRSKQLYERAFFFKRLAIGAADPKFATKLQALVDEYEKEAARAKLEIEQPAALREAAAASWHAGVSPRASKFLQLANSLRDRSRHPQHQPTAWQRNTSPATSGTSY